MTEQDIADYLKNHPDFLPIAQNYFNRLVFRMAMKKGRFR